MQKDIQQAVEQVLAIEREADAIVRRGVEEARAVRVRSAQAANAVREEVVAKARREADEVIASAMAEAELERDRRLAETVRRSRRWNVRPNSSVEQRFDSSWPACSEGPRAKLPAQHLTSGGQREPASRPLRASERRTAGNGLPTAFAGAASGVGGFSRPGGSAEIAIGYSLSSRSDRATGERGNPGAQPRGLW